MNISEKEMMKIAKEIILEELGKVKKGGRVDEANWKIDNPKKDEARARKWGELAQKAREHADKERRKREKEEAETLITHPPGWKAAGLSPKADPTYGRKHPLGGFQSAKEITEKIVNSFLDLIEISEEFSRLDEETTAGFFRTIQGLLETLSRKIQKGEHK